MSVEQEVQNPVAHWSVDVQFSEFIEQFEWVYGVKGQAKINKEDA